MQKLPQTSQALYELRARHERGFGGHLGEHVAAGVPGIEVGEVPFDPTRHDFDAINAASMLETMLDTPHVTQVVPYRPVGMNIVLHQESPERQVRASWMRSVPGHKRTLAGVLEASIRGSEQPTDKSKLYIVGDTDGATGMSHGAEVIAGTEEPEAAAQAIADICMRGLTFVISDFKRLPLHELASADFSSTIAVKVNHPLELELPAKRGSISIGGLTEVNTNKSKELRRANEELCRANDATEAKLGQTGLEFAQVVFDGNTEAGFNMLTADHALATAIGVIDRR